MNQNIALRIFHFVCAITLPLALLLLVSCIQAHEEHVPLGPQFDPSQLDAVVNKATQGATVANLQKNQMLHYEETVRIDGRDPALSMSTNILSVIDRSSNPDTDSVRITYHHSNNYRDENNAWHDVETEDTYDIPNSSAVSAGLLLNINRNDIKTLSDSLDLSPMSQPIHITYHNLQTSEADIDPPDTIKNKAGCSGIPNCRLHVTYLSFDEAQWTDDSHYMKISWRYTLTAQLPYMEQLFGVMVERCAGLSGVSAQDGKKHYIQDCQFLSDAQM